MSFNRLNYDTCTYKQNLLQSVGVGDYVLGMPQINCGACFSPDPTLRQGIAPATIQPLRDLVDTDSELMGITRRATNCPQQHYLPGPSVLSSVQVPLQDCRALPVETTRLSNPPCTLRGNGWNRWEWLCQDPQNAGVEMPFRYNVNERMLAKDNHRPCVQQPLNQSPSLPPWNNSDEMLIYDVRQCSDSTPPVPRSPYWGSCVLSEQRISGKA